MPGRRHPGQWVERNKIKWCCYYFICNLLFIAAAMGDARLYACFVLLLMARASADCSASGVTGTDNADDCAVLLAAYAAWGNNPVSWATGIAAETSYCSWDTGTIQACSDGRVAQLCVARQPALPGDTMHRGPPPQVETGAR